MSSVNQDVNQAVNQVVNQVVDQVVDQVSGKVSGQVSDQVLNQDVEKVNVIEFCKFFNQANSLQEVADRFNLSKIQVSARASQYRKKGVNLKHMPGRGRRKLVINDELVNIVNVALQS